MPDEKISCRHSTNCCVMLVVGINIDDHFREVTYMVQLGSSVKRDTIDFVHTRYACYLIALNGDFKKEEIACAQSYLAVQHEMMVGRK